MDVPVTLVVKVPNHQFEDYTVQCEESWTVKRLKQHLSEVYPCKPAMEEQKLIYSGQLLADKVVIKDILRHYDGSNPPVHTFHLVYTPKARNLAYDSVSSQNPKVSMGERSSSSSDGLRHRNVQSSTSSTSVNVNTRNQQVTEPVVNQNIPQQQTINTAANCPTSMPNVFGNFGGMGFPNQQPNDYLMAQQVAMQNWMQQAYMQYMNQYMNLVSLGVRPETVYMQNSPATTPLQPNVGVSQISHNFPLTNMNLPSTSGSAFSTDNAAPRIPTSVPPTETAVPQVQQPAPEPEAQQPQPRFPNIVQEEIPDNRDWLDRFYTIMRLMMLLTLICFYSSPLRCLIVFVIGLTIYFYHIGVIRTPTLQRNEANNNINNTNNNNRAEQAENRPEPEQPNQEAVEPPIPNDGAESNSRNDTNNTPNQTPPANDTPEVVNNATTVIDFIKTFVISFFVSLLPDTQAL